jgi:hypothetical protein
MSEKDIEDLREATREAHAAIKDLRLATKEAKEAGAEALLLIRNEIAGQINVAVEEGLRGYKAALDAAIEDGTKKVMGRFDHLAELLMGEDKKSRRQGKPTIPELIEQRGGDL